MNSATAIAWLPCAPILVPEIGSGNCTELTALRASVAAAVDVVLASAPDAVVVVAPTAESIVIESDTEFRLSFHGFGIGEPPTGPALPWQLGLGAWLLAAAGWTGERGYLGVGGGVGDSPMPAANHARGIGLLVMADGACHGDLLTGGDAGTADAWDRQLTEVLRSGDPRQLEMLEATVGRSVMSTAAQVWPAVARLLQGSPTSWTATLLRASRPWDVGYLVAHWT